MHNPFIAPSVLAADFLHLEDDLHMVNRSEADWLHVDIMDGVFVPNISFGSMLVEMMHSICNKPLDVHLMIVEPEKYIDTYRQAGAQIITVHYEACPHIHRTIHQIKETGAKAGVAINPGTPVSMLQDVIEHVDLVCCMSVNPGFGGQKFIYHTLSKIRQLNEMRIIHNIPFLIEVDGGVGLQNAEAILKAGADVLVAGNSVFRAEHPEEVIHALKGLPNDVSLS